MKKLADLPLIHKDPFDRLLISTALAEDLTIITADENIQRYDVSWIW
ncbi:MAG: PIN domain-containing protein [Oscillospiraceae bacterium]|nr:PIN domain-containing protein [Oscillospiraceae bacterium]